MPIGTKIEAAFDRGDLAAVASLIVRSPIEAWYALPPDRFTAILRQLPSSVINDNRLLFAFHSLVSGEIDVSEPFLSRVTSDLTAIIPSYAYSLAARLQGMPTRAAAAMDALAEHVLPAQPLFDPGEGVGIFLALHRGLTYLLAGRLGDAVQSFSQAKVVPPPASLTMLLRDAYAKSAVTHALFGSFHDARADIALAHELPLTTSWAEPIVTAHLEIAEALVAPAAEIDAAIEQIERIPPFLVGEMWPFWISGIFRLHMRAGHPRRGLERAEQFITQTPAMTATEGYPRSALPLVRGFASLVLGDSAVAWAALEEADGDILMTRLLRAAISIREGTASAQAAVLVGLRADTEPFAQLEGIRGMLLSWALLELGNEEHAALILSEMAQRTSGEEVMMMPVQVEAFAQAHVYGWSPSANVIDASPFDADPLTPRELQVLTLLASDRTREQIAGELFVSLNTVKSQITSIFRKLGVTRRIDAILVAQQRRLIP